MGEALQKMAERLGRIEDELRQIKLLLKNGDDRPWWQKTAGMFKEDPLFDEMVAEMRKNREADYADAERQFARPAKRPRVPVAGSKKGEGKRR